MILSNCDFVRLKFPNGASIDLQPDNETFAHLPHPPFMLRESDLSNSEVGRWGMRWMDIEMTGYVDNKPLISRALLADPVATKLEVKAGRLVLTMIEMRPNYGKGVGSGREPAAIYRLANNDQS